MMREPIFPVVLILLVSVCGPAVRSQTSGVARMEAMGGASAALDGFWSVLHNPAGMTTSGKPAAGVSTSQPYLLSSLRRAVLGMVYPVGQNAFGLTYQQTGVTGFREQKAGLAYSREFGRTVRAGLRFHYVHLSISDGYGRSGGIMFEAGIQILVSRTIVLGAHVVNPIGAKGTGNEDEKPPGRILIGSTFRITQQFLTVVELEKELGFGPSFKMGMEYALSRLFTVRIGYASLPAPDGGIALPVSSLLSFGAGLNISGFDVGIAGSMHSALGWTPVVSLRYGFGKNEIGEGS